MTYVIGVEISHTLVRQFVCVGFYISRMFKDKCNKQSFLICALVRCVKYTTNNMFEYRVYINIRHMFRGQYVYTDLFIFTLKLVTSKYICNFDELKNKSDDLHTRYTVNFNF